jgi:N-acetylmuramoyl-L-alanine amidase
MFKLLSQGLFVLFFCLTLVSSSALINIEVVVAAQESVALPVDAKDKLSEPVDQSNVVIPACSLKVLESPIGVGISQKDKFLSGCIQGIIRFVIVLAVLAAVIKVAATGLIGMSPVSIGRSDKPASIISNLVVGLFLLLVGWNLLPTINASFANQKYLALPTYSVCPMKSNNKCETYDESRTRVASEAIKKYEASKLSKKWLTSKFDNNYTINVLDSICRARLDDVSYKDIDRAFCKEEYRKFLESIAPKEVTASSGTVDESLLVKVPNYNSNTSKGSERGTISTSLPPLITLHHTAGPRNSIEGNRNAIETGVGTAPSVQFGILDDPNKVDYFMEMLTPGSHAVGTWNVGGYSSKSVNSQSFGIEIYYNPTTGEIPNENQITATAKLLTLLEKKYNSGPDQVTFHGEIDPEYRMSEPWGLVFDGSKHGVIEELKIHPNWSKLVSKVRSYGGWKSGSFEKLSDDNLAKYIFRRNLENGKTQSPGGSKYSIYESWLNNNK